MTNSKGQNTTQNSDQESDQDPDPDQNVGHQPSQVQDDKELKELRFKRGQLKAAVTRLQTTLNSLKGSQINPIDLRNRRTKLDQTWDTYDEVQTRIELITEDIGESSTSERKIFEESYYAALAKIDSLILPTITTNSAASSSSQQGTGSTITNIQTGIRQSNDDVRLPKVELPNFSGSYDSWSRFRDTFESLVHNNSRLSDIQKFHYLLSSVQDEAAEILESVEIAAANYEDAWTLVKDRYENKLLIVQENVKAIFELPVITKDNRAELRILVNGVRKRLSALKRLERPVDSWDDLIIHIVTSKIDHQSRADWTDTLEKGKLPKLKALLDFLDHKCETLESMARATHSSSVLGATKGQGKSKNSGNSKSSSKKGTASHFSSNQSSTCPMCKGPHPVYACNNFKEMTPEQRIKQLKSVKICTNCLRSSTHTASNCEFGACKKCKKRHNTLLHISSYQQQSSGQQEGDATSTNSSNQQAVPVTSANLSRQQTISQQVLLPTARINVYDKHGNLHECRTLLDSGSQSNFIRRDLAKRLGLSQKPISLSIAGIGNSSSQAHTFTQVRIKSRFNAYIADLDCLILNEITGNLPVSSLNVELEIPQGIKLADPDFDKSAPIDLLIGAEIFWELLCVGQLRAAKNHPALQKTQLGWVVAGKSVTWLENHSARRVCNLAIADERQLATVMSKFFRLEHNPLGNTFTPEERYCESYYEQTTKRAQDQRFIVRLPIKQHIIKGLGQTKDIARKRFLSLEKKLNHNPDLRKKYTEFIHEYKGLGHMQQVKDSASTASPSFYLPHHPVIKESSQTTKLRVVFDGSCKSSTGVSLNDTLMVGPTLQQDLFSILVRFRTFQVTLKADIAKMYRQILIDRSETPLQRILWRDNPTDDIQTYELLTVTYGTASGSYLAIKTLHHLANLEKNSFPRASALLLRDFYVDDLLTGADTVEEARIIRDELIALLKKGGFDLRQWSSNSQEVLQDMMSDPSAEAIFSLDKEETTKTLGIQWNSREDAFQYSIPIASKPSMVTKRTMLSSIAQIFDPLGLLGPLIISAKILMQRLWQLQIDWDQSVPMEIHTKWTEYQAELQALNHLKIPRKIINKSADSDIEMHGFSDACQEAYGACIYIRCSNRDGTHSTQLICSKSRVAPLKNISLPRLELCGALLLAQITSRVKEILNVDVKKTYYWTDSTVVLNWISASSRKWNTFVANRVGEIHDLCLRSDWHHVGGTDNPADIISRGMGCSQLLQATLWWQGPAWLSQDQSSWPKSKFVASDETIELRKNVVTLTTTNVDFNLINRFSSFTKLIRITAYLLRFRHNVSCKNGSKLSGYLTTLEINQATNCLIKMIQREVFKNEYYSLLNKRDIPKKSHLLGLNPFLDKDGIIRVGGRIQKAQLPYTAKCQIILPAKHGFTNLLIEYEHKRNLHAGSQGTLAAIRTKYWPLAAKVSIISSIRRCIKCFRNSPSTTQYIMGDLPSRRLTPARPFTNCGVDYCGPIMIREGRRRNSKLTKAYVAIFVCFATKAVHIELAGDLTTEAFLCALKRLISRRGRVANIYSDNGTNFIGANNELQELRDLFNEEDHQRKISSLGMEEDFTWHFIPPRAPNFGGLWEAAVKSTKTHLKRVIGEAHLTYEEMYTLLVQIESILNSRPLTPMSNDPNDLSFLTPGHFLIGDSFRSLPEPDLKTLTLNSLSRWQHVEYIKQHFWSRWYKEYLNQHQQRTKWRTSNSEPLAVGQMVIIREDNLPPLRWLLGRVEKIYPGSDGIARAASVKTAKSTFDRPANKLCILPIKDNQISSL